MAAARLPDDPSFKQFRKQAKDLCDLSRAGIQGALDLVGAHHPDGSHAVSLAGAQFVTARHYGFSSWAPLRRHVLTIEHYRRAPDEVTQVPSGRAADEFLMLACLRYGGDDAPDRWQRAARLLAEHPEITRISVHAAAAAADAGALEALLRDDPSLARAEGGPYRWEPVLYLGYARHDPSVSEDATVRSARLLLEHGVDLRTPFEAEEDRIVRCVNACDGRTPAEVAAVCGCWAVLDLLAKYGVPSPAAEGADGLIAAALAGDRRTAEWLAGHAGAARAQRPGLIVWAASLVFHLVDHCTFIDV